jgi:hypothetical protein
MKNLKTEPAAVALDIQGFTCILWRACRNERICGAKESTQHLSKHMAIQSPDLTKQAPRSARVRLGGYVTLPRMLDKGRATTLGKNGEYHYNCPMDQRFVNFVGIDPEAMKQELASGKSDSEILEWIQANAKHKRSDVEIAAWSAYQEQRTPTDPETRAYFNELHSKAAPKRSDIVGWFDLLDVDDYVSYGGKA